MRSEIPNSVPYYGSWAHMLHEAGLREIKAKTFILDLIAPFNKAQSEFIILFLTRTLKRTVGEECPLSSEDQEVIGQLVDPTSEYFLLRKDHLHIQIGDTVYTGVKP